MCSLFYQTQMVHANKLCSAEIMLAEGVPLSIVSKVFEELPMDALLRMKPA
ncbi:hypothetical protein GCM10010995_23250 [Cysteiniphilum litorale]|uniref:Uncharacterized protein n=1 Tax=Cysteiniphilum litorale TaxID=2056700 RepID=A0A8J2Z685_9GAMM|nr:hypothetical protein GCM10010995_23250 [Cysteiniphilum litorale]